MPTIRQRQIRRTTKSRRDESKNRRLPNQRRFGSGEYLRIKKEFWRYRLLVDGSLSLMITQKNAIFPKTVQNEKFLFSKMSRDNLVYPLTPPCIAIGVKVAIPLPPNYLNGPLKSIQF
jgi:hypothetical protein